MRAGSDDSLTATAQPQILRLLRYEIDEARLDALQKAFGNVEIINLVGFQFGPNPVAEMLKLLEEYGSAVAVELVGPLEVLEKITAEKDRFRGVVFIKAEFIRSSTGRPVAMGLSPVTGEDTLIFHRYVVLKKVEYVTTPLKNRE